MDKLLFIESGGLTMRGCYHRRGGTNQSILQRSTAPIFSPTCLEKLDRFTFRKSLHAVIDCLKVSGLRKNSDGVVLDYFAGSGTTAHAVIELNRADGGSRSYILVDMAEYFDSALMPRIRKAAYAAEWKDGKPKTHSSGSSHAMKYLRLESYEDALTILSSVARVTQQSLLDANEAQEVNGLREQYILRYMLDVETRGSQSLTQRPCVYRSDGL